ncbi:hypothetical protein F4703DRAFT_1844337 [Phycomyces blakesleeanus]
MLYFMYICVTFYILSFIIYPPYFFILLCYTCELSHMTTILLLTSSLFFLVILAIIIVSISVIPFVFSLAHFHSLFLYLSHTHTQILSFA